MGYEYLLRGVQLKEYEALKGDRSRLIDETMQGFNDVWRPKTKNIRATFKYNPGREAVGIFLQNHRQEQLVLDSEGLTKAQDAVVGSLYGRLKERLDRLRIPHENWEE